MTFLLSSSINKKKKHLISFILSICLTYLVGEKLEPEIKITSICNTFKIFWIVITFFLVIVISHNFKMHLRRLDKLAIYEVLRTFSLSRLHNHPFPLMKYIMSHGILGFYIWLEISFDTYTTQLSDPI